MRTILLLLLGFVFVGSMAQAQMVDLSAHRGDRSYFRENTLSAFKAALSSAASSIEFDVHLTKDLVPVIYHDYSLNPKDFVGLESPVLIKDLTLEQLQAIHFKNDKPLLAGDVAVPTLQDFFNMVKTRSEKGYPPKTLHVEIKSEEAFLHESATPAELVSKTLEVIDRTPFPDEIIVRSFNWDVLEILKKVRPQIKRILLVDEGQLARIDVAATVRRYQPVEISPYYKDVTAESIQAWKQFGIGLSPWTVNDPVELMRLIRMGIVGFATDQPYLQSKVLQKNSVPVGIKANSCKFLFRGRNK